MFAEKEKVTRTACVEISKSVGQFRKDRIKAWSDLYKCEAVALEAEMRAKRSKGRPKLTMDPYARGCKLRHARKSAAYLAAAEASETAALAAAKAFENAHVELGIDDDSSDADCA